MGQHSTASKQALQQPEQVTQPAQGEHCEGAEGTTVLAGATAAPEARRTVKQAPEVKVLHCCCLFF